jgi:nitroreductase
MMDIERAIRGRRSIRRYLPDPVPEETVRAILDEARWAPSWTNTQCWDVYVVTGEPLERIKAANIAKFESGDASAPDIRMPGREWPERFAERTRRMMERRLPAAAAGEAGGKPDPAASMPALYGAPCFLVFAVDEALVTEYACFDTGLMVQNVCLAAHERGLGTCIMAMAIRFADVVRRELPGIVGRRLVIGVALGYPDAEAPINQFERERVDPSECVTWVTG